MDGVNVVVEGSYKGEYGVKNKTQWYKYRNTWSHGKDSKWQYTDIPWHYKTAKDYFQSFANDYKWSEHYRGVEWIKIKRPPKEYVEERIRETQNALKSNRNELKELKELKEMIDKH